MTPAERGTKRRCPNCGALFYDLNRSPLTCPKCGTAFQPEERLARSPPRRAPSRPVRAPVEPEVPVESEGATEGAFDEDEILVHDEDEDETFTGDGEGESEDGDGMRE
jgi:uncharacterized protein (TIGR02300 family)